MNSEPMMYFNFDDDLNDPDYRSKQEYPYSYSPICVYKSSEHGTDCLYSDRLFIWYEYDVVREKMKKHFGESGDYYSNRSVKSITTFLADLLGKPTLKVTLIEEQCNIATGYPVWFFEYKEEEN